MKKFWKIIIALGIVAILAASFMFYRLWFMPHRDVQNEIAVVVDAQHIMDAYNADPTKANALYLDKAIEVTGEAGDINKNQQGKTVLTLKTNNPMAGIRCTMKEEVKVASGQTVTVKGQCTGFLMDVTLIDCYIIK